MGKISEFFKGDNDAGATGGSDPATAGNRTNHGRTGSLTGSTDNSTGSNRGDSMATARKDAVGDHGTRGHNSVAADSLDGATGTRGRNSGSTGGRMAGDAEAVATGNPGQHHRNHTDADGDGLDDRSTGNQERMIGANGDFGQKHSLGHPQRSKNHDLTGAEETHAHLAPIMHEKVSHHETEEVLREREKHDHIHHVKHAVVPIHDREVRDEVHHNHVHPNTRIEERHVNSQEDNDTFAAIGARHKDTLQHHPQTNEVVDLGERVRTHDHHHVHHVVQPVIEKETHDRHRKHTTIPIHHTTHQAPIIHDSVHHSPISMAEFTKRGGKLDSTTTHSQAGESVLASTECERKVDGPAEGLMSKLHLK